MIELFELLKVIPTWALISLAIVLLFITQALFGIIVWFFKDFWHNRTNRLEKHEKALSENTLAIVKLQLQIERLTDLLIIVPKLKEDVNWSHEKIRENSKGTSETKEQIEKLVLSGISELLSRPGSNHYHRNWQKLPLTHKEQLWLIQTLHKELSDPEIPAPLIFLYGRILDFVAEQISYN